MICICVLASGSKGNAVFLASPDAKILIDAGLSGKEIERKMGEIGFSPQELDAILVSHEHRDHVLGVGVLYRRFGTPVYITTPTLGKAGPIIGKVKGTVEINPGSSFLFRDLKIYPFEVPHDAVNPINFIVTYEGVKIGIATDLGFAPNLVKQNLKGCRALIVETNHDREMLENGPYPWPLKQRVKGRHGHLSNEQGARLLYDVIHPNLQHVCLAHLSETNNLPEKAVVAVRGFLGEKLNNIDLQVANQNRVGKKIVIEP